LLFLKPLSFHLLLRALSLKSFSPPSHNTCFKFIGSDLGQKISLNVRTSDLPDRCEALSQTIRDTIKITNKLKRGDIVGFNDSQVAIFFLMLAHYVCDAHVPVHCDNRDLYKPSKVHPDLEEFWEEEIFKYYRVSKRLKQFDLDQDQTLQRDERQSGFEDSILGKCDEVLEQSKWTDMNKESQKGEGKGSERGQVSV
jgi:hypothetical protein